MMIRLIVIFALAALNASAQRFDFSGSKPAPGVTAVSPASIYSEAHGFGFEPGAKVVADDGGISSDQPFLFSVKLPEGNYAVTVKLGGAKAKSVTTVKAELRRLMLEKIVTAPGNFETRTFIVNLRTPAISGDDHVRLKSRERDTEMVAWDNKLTLEFNGTHPALAALEIVPTNVPTVYLLGDSTVCDQPRAPWNSWGQMLPRFFKPTIAVANHAESGESIRSSLGARRFEKVFSLMKPGDWLLIQYGHNDMKDKATNALAVYKSNLKKIVAQTRDHGGTPVLVTSMERKAGIEHDTLAGYPDTVRAVAKEGNVALIDLHAVSKIFYRALGAKLDLAFQDGTHHNNYGSYELARCIVAGIRANVPALAGFLWNEATSFDPSHPDDPDTFTMAVSPAADARKPEGS